jgi:hypothetical protein
MGYAFNWNVFSFHRWQIRSSIAWWALEWEHLSPLFFLWY